MMLYGLTDEGELQPTIDPHTKQKPWPCIKRELKESRFMCFKMFMHHLFFPAVTDSTD